MTDVIAHRSPDGEDHYTDTYISIGHRRLAIIDLSFARHQPMISVNKQMVLSYIGEVYNFQKLHLELEKLGYQFCSRTDLEVVLNSWVKWGEMIVCFVSTVCLPLQLGTNEVRHYF